MVDLASRHPNWHVSEPGTGIPPPEKKVNVRHHIPRKDRQSRLDEMKASRRRSKLSIAKVVTKDTKRETS
ncbi:hypothetical protein CONLIGDRAFT_686807 [Coniochaeta ligniaria NRRL 30616]|uniref:Uncharacterized protein n=1 Tax=Coniochaeta ligniaria NRRL 30616 TaxID=1408157 RepID=A0A1J7I7M7_9PEZI|nr:hypothetical protein CONLIGDRAFT_686807 [Coniochaeta ligniaria NRRL 30616]